MLYFTRVKKQNYEQNLLHFQMKEQDVENVRLIVIQPNQVTDTNVLVRSPNIEHYRSLRLTLSLESNPHSPIYHTKLDPSGYSPANNPGLLYALPRLPADNRTYVLQLDCALSKVTHAYDEHVFYFASDGKFRSFDVDFVAKVSGFFLYCWIGSQMVVGK